MGGRDSMGDLKSTGFFVSHNTWMHSRSQVKANVCQIHIQLSFGGLSNRLRLKTLKCGIIQLMADFIQPPLSLTQSNLNASYNVCGGKTVYDLCMT